VATYNVYVGIPMVDVVTQTERRNFGRQLWRTTMPLRQFKGDSCWSCRSAHKSATAYWWAATGDTLRRSPQGRAVSRL